MAEDWYDDEDLDGDDTGEGSKGARKQDDAAAQIRRLKKELKEAKDELVPLREFKSTAEARDRATDVGKVFEAVKLSPAQAKLFLLENPEFEGTPEEKAAKVVAWAKSYGITPSLGSSEEDADEGEDADSDADASTGFAPLQTSEGQAPAPKSKKISAKELLAIAAKDPAKAERIMREGGADVLTSEPSTGASFQPSAEDIKALWD